MPRLLQQHKSLASQIADGLTIQCRVLFALVLRETKTRYGEHKLGFIWAFVEPMVMVTLMSAIFGAMGTIVTSDVHFTAFLITGFVPFAMLRDTMSQTQGAIMQNTSLLGFPQVSTFDLVFARALLEIGVLLTVFALMLIGANLIGIDVQCENPLGVLTVCLLLWVMGLGMGLLLASVTPVIPSTRQLSTQILGRPLFLGSGIFFTADSLPEGIREYLLYNPVLHLIELMRSEYFYGFESPYADWNYAIKCTFGILAFGLVVQRAMRKRAIIGI